LPKGEDRLVRSELHPNAKENAEVCRAAISTSRSLRERAALHKVTAMWDELATNSSIGTSELAEQVELVACIQARILGYGIQSQVAPGDQ
jgi:hypothetical protein